MTPNERFWVKVDKSGECWVWTGARSGKGSYGYFNLNAHGFGVVRAHRAALFFSAGEMPPGHLFVCHACDNPPCVRPDHLFLGTPRDNIVDMWSKGRGNGSGREQGESRYNHRLTEVAVTELRARRAHGESVKTLAKDYGVSDVTIRLVVARKAWKHVA